MPSHEDQAVADLEVFPLEGCPRCTDAEPFIQKLRRERPDLRIIAADVSTDETARSRLHRLATERGVQALGTPTFFVGGELIIGWVDEETTGARIRKLLPPESATTRETGSGATESPKVNVRDAMDVPGIGPLSVNRLGLALFSIVIGLLDGFNPCAMWALLFLLSMLANLHDRRKMFMLGAVFILVGGALYFAFMAAWLEVFILVGLTRAAQVALGAIALVVGGVNVKDFFAFGKGISLSIPAKAKPGIYESARRILTAQNLMGALAAVVAVSMLVNVVELLCTAGLPALYTEILAAQQLSRRQYYGYLLLYNVAYILDDAVMLGVAVVTLDRLKLQERGGRWLKLLSGVVMLTLGLMLLFKPRWLV